MADKKAKATHPHSAGSEGGLGGSQGHQADSHQPLRPRRSERASSQVGSGTWGQHRRDAGHPPGDVAISSGSSWTSPMASDTATWWSASSLGAALGGPGEAQRRLPLVAPRRALQQSHIGLRGRQTRVQGRKRPCANRPQKPDGWMQRVHLFGNGHRMFTIKCTFLQQISTLSMFS